MNGIILESQSIKIEILPDGQEIIKDIISLTTNSETKQPGISCSDMALLVGDALMYYKILLEHKNKGGETLLKLNNQEVKLPVISSIG